MRLIGFRRSQGEPKSRDRRGADAPGGKQTTEAFRKTAFSCQGPKIRLLFRSDLIVPRLERSQPERTSDKRPPGGAGQSIPIARSSQAILGHERPNRARSSCREPRRHIELTGKCLEPRPKKIVCGRSEPSLTPAAGRRPQARRPRHRAVPIAAELRFQPSRDGEGRTQGQKPLRRLARQFQAIRLLVGDHEVCEPEAAERASYSLNAAMASSNRPMRR